MALTDGIALLSSQYAYDGAGPFDAKMLVTTFAELTTEATWKNSNGDNLAYNGMIVAVWRERNENAYKNGIYFLHDGTTKRNPDVTNEANWHKIDANVDVSEILNKIGDVADNTTLVDMISNALQAAKDYANGIVGEVAADLVESTQSINNTIADLTNKFATVETTIANNTESIADLLNNVNNYAADMATLIGDDRNAETGEVKSIRTIAAEELNSLIEAADPAGGKTIENIRKLVEYVDENAGEIATLIDISSSTANKLNGIDTTVAEAIAKAKEEVIAEVADSVTVTVGVATTETVGGIKSSTDDIENAVSVDAEGNATVQKINVNTLTQTKGESLVLDGGNAIA